MNVDPTNELGTREKRLAIIGATIKPEMELALKQAAMFDELLRYVEEYRVARLIQGMPESMLADLNWTLQKARALVNK